MTYTLQHIAALRHPIFLIRAQDHSIGEGKPAQRHSQKTVQAYEKEARCSGQMIHHALSQKTNIQKAIYALGVSVVVEPLQSQNQHPKAIYALGVSIEVCFVCRSPPTAMQPSLRIFPS